MWYPIASVWDKQEWKYLCYSLLSKPTRRAWSSGMPSHFFLSDENFPFSFLCCSFFLQVSCLCLLQSEGWGELPGWRANCGCDYRFWNRKCSNVKNVNWSKKTNDSCHNRVRGKNWLRAINQNNLEDIAHSIQNKLSQFSILRILSFSPPSSVILPLCRGHHCVF